MCINFQQNFPPIMSLGYFISFASIFCVAFGDPIVSIDQGKLNGKILQSRGGKLFNAFYSIPYAQPPVGELRFAPPQKAPSWQGIRDATKTAPICWQPERIGVKNTSLIGQEDCLYLSVFTPQIKPEKLFPVLVFIHGGAFQIGGGDKSGPHYFMDEPIILVTLNHRLGIFGYLSATDDVIPGNYGLKDQAAALKWVQSNIAHFGGDPTSVTLMGQSSSSVCVHLHTMSPLSEGLFHRAIMESGSGLTFWSHYNEHHCKSSYNDVVERLNCKFNTTIKTLQCLQLLPAEQLIRAEQHFASEKEIIVKFRPAIEKSTVENAFMVTSPYELRHRNRNIPWIIGFNSAETLQDANEFLKSVIQSDNISEKLRAILPSVLHYRYFVKQELLSNVTDSLIQFYFENGTVSKNDSQKICNLLSDLTFNMATLEAAYNYSGSRYFYYFDYEMTVPYFLLAFQNTTDTNGIKGAAHSDELFTLFTHSFIPNLRDPDTKLSQHMITYWTNFAITGNPNTPNDHVPRWDAFNPDSGNYLHIANDKITMRKQLLHDRYDFWKKLTHLARP